MKSLINAIVRFEFEQAYELIDSGYHINERDEWGVTPLMLAVERKYFHMVKKLIKKGADVNALDTNDNNVLFYSIYEKGQDQMIEVLLDAGCDPEIVNEYGFGLIDQINNIHYEEEKLKLEMLSPLFERIDNFSEGFQKQLKALRLELLF